MKIILILISFLFISCSPTNNYIIYSDNIYFNALIEEYNKEQKDHFFLIKSYNTQDIPYDADLIVSSKLQLHKENLSTLNFIFNKINLQTKIYDDFLTLGKNKNNDLKLLPFSFSLPIIVYHKDNFIEGSKIISFEDIVQKSKEFTKVTEKKLTQSGFYPFNDIDFMHNLFYLAGSSFFNKEQFDLHNPEQFALVMDQIFDLYSIYRSYYFNFEKDHNYIPSYKLVLDKKLLTYQSSLEDFFKLPYSLRKNLDFSYISQNNAIMANNYSFIGLKNRPDSALEKLLIWIYDEESQKKALTNIHKMHDYSFTSLSSIKNINHSFINLQIEDMLFTIPPEEYIKFFNSPLSFENYKKEVLKPALDSALLQNNKNLLLSNLQEKNSEWNVKVLGLKEAKDQEIITIEEDKYITLDKVYYRSSPKVEDPIIFNFKLSLQSIKTFSWAIEITKEGTIIKTLKGLGSVPDNVVWDAKAEDGSITEGEYAYSLILNNPNGTQERFEQGNLIIDQTPPTATIAIKPTSFTPDNDGQNDILYIDIEALDSSGSIGDWTFTIFKDKEVFYSFKDSQKGTISLTWDGLSIDKKVVESKTNYPYQYKVQDKAGNESIYEGFINVGILVLKTEGSDNLKIVLRAIIFMPNSAAFYTDSSANGQANIETLNELVDVLNKYSDYKVQIEGHSASTQRQSPEEIELEERIFLKPLSLQRAQSVRNYLVGKGIAASRIITIGYGGTKPLVSHDDLVRRAENRRVEFLLIKE